MGSLIGWLLAVSLASAAEVPRCEGPKQDPFGVFAVGDELCGCSGSELSCQPQASGMCFAKGQWVASGSWGPSPDGCNDRKCVDGQWTATTLLDCRVQITQRVAFKDRSSRLEPEVLALLDEVARVLLDHPELARWAIEGHAHRSERRRAEPVSLARAEAVRQALIDRGVPPERLETVGWGSRRPVDGTANDRRVELVLRDDAALPKAPHGGP